MCAYTANGSLTAWNWSQRGCGGGVIVGALVTLAATRSQRSTALAVVAKQIHAETVLTARIDWINRLRNAIAEFQACLTDLMVLGSVARSEDREIPSDEHGQVVARASLAHSKIHLLINPNEDDHTELASMVSRALGQAGRGFSEEKGITEITSIGQRVLKREWEVVKEGPAPGKALKWWRW